MKTKIIKILLIIFFFGIYLNSNGQVINARIQAVVTKTNNTWKDWIKKDGFISIDNSSLDLFVDNKNVSYKIVNSKLKGKYDMIFNVKNILTNESALIILSKPENQVYLHTIDGIFEFMFAVNIIN